MSEKHFNHIFSEHFKLFKDNYVIIGGTAAAILMLEAEVDARATRDYDIVLIIEVMDVGFNDALIQFIQAGNYQENQEEQENCLYRFRNPINKNYPEVIEFFSRKPADINLRQHNFKVPLHFSNDVQSLSAILLDDNYYELLKAGKRNVYGMTVLDTKYLIIFKMKAWLDLTTRKKLNNKSVKSKDIKKHLHDIFRLHEILENQVQIQVSKSIKKDIKNFMCALCILGENSINQLNYIQSTYSEIVVTFQKIYVYE